MSVLNTSAVRDWRKVISGKDAGLYDESGNLLASFENYHSQVAITNQTYQPLGDAQEHAVMTGFRVTLTASEIVVESGEFFRQLLDGLRTHKMPVWNIRGMERSPYNGSEEQVVYRDCVPDGSIDIQNMQVGEFYKRAWNFVVNQPPELQSILMND